MLTTAVPMLFVITPWVLLTVPAIQDTLEMEHHAQVT